MEGIIDILILKALSNRKRFISLRSAVPNDMVSADTQAMLAWFSMYFSTFPDRENIDLHELAELVKLRSGGQGQEQIALTLHLVQQLQVPVAAESLQGILAQLQELDLAGRAGAVIARYNSGEEVELSFELQNMASQTRRSIAEGGKASWADADIGKYLAMENDEGGLQWSMFPVLENRLKGVRPGINIAVAAPTDQGKTSLLCYLAAGFARQAHELHPGRPLLYLVNEGTQERITVRMYQTVLQCTMDELQKFNEEGTLLDRYAAVLHKRDAIRVANIHGKNLAQVEDLIGRHNPYMVITDMTGRIRSMTNKGGMNDISQLEDVWNSIREMTVIQDFAHIGTVQVSAEGFDMLYPPLSAMQNSKTGIQTTLDLCLMMGALNNPEAAKLRGLSTPKNKLGRSGCTAQNQVQMYFDPTRNSWDMGTV